MRETAYKVRIKTVLENPYIKQEGWDPNYIEYQGHKISRVNIIGIITSKENNSFLFDDGTGSITLRTFNNVNVDVEVGKIYLVVARPREYEGSRYLVPEIARPLDDPTWVELREKELFKPGVKEVKKEEQKVEEKPEQKNTDILDLIAKLDTGSGASVESIAKEAGNCDHAIKLLIEQGDIFEIKPGVVKIL